MGILSSIGNIVKSVTKPIKKVIKSPVGIAALVGLGLPAYAKYGSAGGWPGAKGILGSGSKMAGLGDWLYGTAAQTGGTELAGGRMVQKAIPATKGIFAKHPYITAGVGTALTAGAAAPELEETLDISVDDKDAHKNYLTNRGMFEDEWAEWLVSSGKAETKEEALELVRNNPMFSKGGRVKAQGGLFAGQMPGRHPGMNPMTQMNQGLGAPNLGPRSMGMTPGGGQMDPRMAQMMQAQKLQGATRTGAVPRESPDTELIQLIKMLSSLGIPMEQLRGRTKEELVEMLVSVKGKMGGEPDVKETAEVIEEEDIREQQAAGGGRIGFYRGSDRHAGTGSSQSQAPSSGPHGNQGSSKSSDRGPRDALDRHGPTITQPKVTPKGDGILSNARSNLIKGRAERELMNRMGLAKRGNLWGMLGKKSPDLWARQTGNPHLDYTEEDINRITEVQDYFNKGGNQLGLQTPDLQNFNITQDQHYDIFPTDKAPLNTGGGGGDGQPYIWPPLQTAGGITSTGDDDAYYKFAEWDDWKMPGETVTSPMFKGNYKKEVLANTGGLMRTGYAIGSSQFGMGTEHPIIPSKDGQQLDMRDRGGYQPHGKAEKHDDVRALLAQGEFVMTSDAVKGMGGGDREVGAKKMYDLMHNMEAMA